MATNSQPPTADNQPSYRHIIWDWNGTLFDDAWLCVAIMNDMLAKRDMALISAESYAAIFDFPVIDYYRQVGFDFAREPFETVSTEFITGYESRRAECSLRTGTVALLDWVRRQGLGQSILSAAKQDFLRQAVAAFGITDFFNTVNGVADHHAFGKVELGRTWAAQSGWRGDEVVLIGDTIHDYEVAQAIGVDCYLVPSGHQARERLVASGAKVLASPADLMGLLG